MDFFNAKKTLEGYQFNNLLLVEASLQLEELEQKNERLKTKNNGITNFVYEHCIAELKYKVENAKQYKQKVENAINSINETYKNLLFFRYIKNFSYEKISLKLCYSLQRIFQLHNKAITEFGLNFENASSFLHMVK